MIPDPVYKHIGALIKARRKILLLNQEKLAAMLGISRGSLANIETGRQSILVHQLYRFAEALELKPLDLLPELLEKDPSEGNPDLPLPSDLKAQQRKQITDFFQQLDSSHRIMKEKPNAELTKR